VALTGETTTGRLIMQYASENIIPMSLELGGKSPNVFMADVMDQDDDYLDKALEGFTLFAFNTGEVCTCPSRALIDASIFDAFMGRAIKRVEQIKVGNPFDPATMMGAQASQDQLDKIIRYLDIGRQEGAKCVTGGERATVADDIKYGYYMKPTVFVGNNKMRIFQEEIFGPVLSVTSFKTLDEAVEIANDSLYGLGAGMSRNGTDAYRLGREIEAGRVWTNCYHVYSAGAAFGGYKQSGFGRENHRMDLEAYQQTKNLLVSYSRKPMGFFWWIRIGCARRIHRVCGFAASRRRRPYGFASAALDEPGKAQRAPRLMVERVVFTPSAAALVRELRREVDLWSFINREGAAKAVRRCASRMPTFASGRTMFCWARSRSARSTSAAPSTNGGAIRCSSSSTSCRLRAVVFRLKPRTTFVSSPSPGCSLPPS
jgi:hypothetical protein